MGKNVAIFVDVANIFYAAKSAGVDIDYVTLLKAATAGRDFVRAYAYTGLDPENENQRNFHSFLSRHGYKVISKDIRKYGDVKVKANLDIELVVDMMKTARNLDVAIVVSGDGDFAPAIRAVQEMGVRVEVISFRGNTSSDLIEVADIFTDITQLAKVERGSRSGRRVAEEEFDMTLTEIPDKQTEGTGTRQRRGRGRSFRDELPPRTREIAADGETGGREMVAASAVGAGPLVVLPGEKLSRVARPAPAAVVPGPVADDEEFEESEGTAETAGTPAGVDLEAGEVRRRRRRGGRGRGRGRGRAEEGFEGGPDAGPEAGPDAGEGSEEAERPEPAERPLAPVRTERPERVIRPERPARPVQEAPAGPRGPRPTPFGSIWDSQLGMPTAPAAGLGPLPGDDEDEPEIPEYLLSTRRGGPQAQGGQGGRGVRPGYSAAMDRERFGRGGLNRYGEPNRPSMPQSQGRPQQPRRDDRPQQPVIRQERPQRSDEPWSEVSPEIEQMLRAQMAARGPRPGDRPQGRTRPDAPQHRPGAEPQAAPVVEESAAPDGGVAAPGRRRGRPGRPTAETVTPAEDSTTTVEAVVDVPVPAAPRGRTRRAAPAGAQAVAPAAAEPAPAAEAAAAAPRAGRRRAPAAGPAVDPQAGEKPAAPAAAPATAAPARRARATMAAPAAGVQAQTEAAVEVAAPARARRGRAPAATAVAPVESPEPAGPDAAAARPAPRRRTTRSTASSE